MNKYDKLNTNIDPDKERVAQFAALIREIRVLEGRLNELHYIREENEDDLNPYIWKDAAGQVLSIFEIEDAHIMSILNGNFVTGETRRALKKLAVDNGLIIEPKLIEEINF